MTSRIHRGFHRIGVVLAVPVALVAVGLACHEAWWEWDTRDPWAGFTTISTPPGYVEPTHHHAEYGTALVVLLLALALYAAARAVGWVLDGFVRPDRST